METTKPFAWQPITPRGVAAFAGATLGRLLSVQLFFALLAAVVVTWCVRTAWFPVARAAIRVLPEHGEIRSGEVVWDQSSPQTLAENRFLSLVLDLDHSGDLRGPAHVQVELGRRSVLVLSLLGHVELLYPKGWVFALNRPDAEPWWGAWSPVILAGVFAGTVVALMTTWAALACVYWLPVWLLSYLANRRAGVLGAWRLCGAAQLTGGLCMSTALVFYGLGLMDPVRLLVAFVAHFVVGWVYLGVSPMFLASARSPVGGNPFTGAVETQARLSEPPKPDGENPFGSGLG